MNQLSNKEKITQVLLNAFESVYCDSCESCHRKSMNWGISTEYAEEVADEVLNELEAE